MKIQTRIIIAVLLVIVIATAVFGVYLFRTERKNSLARLRTVMEEDERLLAVVIAGPLYDGNIEQLNTTFDSFFSNPDMVRIDLMEYRGNIRISRARGPAAQGETFTGRIAIKRGIDELGEVSVVYSTARIAQALETLRNQILLFSGTLVLVLSVIISLVVRGLTRPIERFTGAARDMANGHLDREIDTRGAEELQSLGQSFIRMRDAIREKMADLAARNEAFQISEDRLQQAIRASEIGIFDHDQRTDTLYWSPLLRQHYGVGPDEPASLSVFIDLVHPDDRDRITASVRRAHDPAGDGIWDVEHRIIRRDGSVRWLKQRSQTFFEGDARRPVRTVGAVLDITERRIADEAQRASEELLRAAVTVARIGIFDHDQRADTVYWSPQQREIHGWGPDEPVSLQSFVDLVHPDDRDRITASVQRAHDPAGDGIWDVEYRIIRRDGSIRWLKDRSQTFFEGEGAARRPVRTIGAALDITERKQGEEEQQKLVSIIETSSDFISIAGLDGRILYVNSSGRNLVGLDSVDDAQSTRIADFLQEQDVVFLEKEVLQTIRQAGNWTGELALRHFKTGMSIPVEMNAFMIRDHSTGQPIAMANISRDITERKRVEAALRESRNLLQTIFDTIPVRVFWKDSDLRYLGCNRPFALDAGVQSPDDIIGKDDYQMGWREQADLYRNDDRQVIQSGAPKINYEEPQTTPDGRHLWLRTSKVPLKHADGTIWGILGTYEDITEYKRAEESLRQAALIVENSPVMLFRWKAVEGWPVVLVSQNVVHLGYTPQELLDGSVLFASIVHPDDVERIGHEVQAYTASGVERFQQEYRLVAKDGRVRWIDDRTMVERDSTGRVTHYQGIVVDVTERKRAETALQQSLSMLQATLESTFDAILVVEKDGARITGYNQRFAELMHIPLNLLTTGDDLPVLQHVTRQLKDPEAFLARVRWLYAHPEEESFDVLELADGRTLERLSRPQRVEGRPVGRVWSFRDITERKRADAERERLIQELETRNAELERFTYTVSHDLKSPLITMRGFLGYLEKDALAGNTERMRTDISRIADATDKMDRLLRELLELSRIGRVMNPPVQVPFEEIAREAVGLVAGRLKEREIRVKIAAGMPVVYGDRVRLVEVVQNLVDNAAKFMGSQPAPLVEIGVRAEERNGKPVFFVRDNGIGIEPRYQAKIFGLFDKLDPNSEGTGIGLALVKRIIEVHGGTIWIESEGSGRGAAFCFTLPGAQVTTGNGG
jgi:PAS domain S-box-containing protein